MKNKAFTIAAVSVLMLSNVSLMPLAASQGPQEPTSFKPANYSTDVALDPLLEARVTDSDDEVLKNVEFKEGFTYDFAGAGSNMSGLQNLTIEDPFLTNSATGAMPFSDKSKQLTAFEDGESLATVSSDKFPSHQFEVNVSENLTPGSNVELYWKGKTHANGQINLSAWDHQAGKWETLAQATSDSDDKEITLSAMVNHQKFINSGKIQAMLHNTPVIQEEYDDPFTMLWFTDTQFYARDYPHVWEVMTDYIVEEYQKGTFGYAFHTGDLVETPDSDAEWAVADTNLSRMEAAGIPYGVLAGNHDVIKTGDTFDYSYFHKYVGADRYRDNEWYGGEMNNNQNHYDLMSFGDHDFIMLYLGYGRDSEPATIQWANEVLKEHSNRNAILAMHVNINHLREHDTAGARTIHEKIVIPNPNVKMVLSGHHPSAKHRVLKVTNPDGSEREVLEVLSNYQGHDIEERGGFMRFMTFDPNNETVQFSTYSPYTKKNYYYWPPESENFTMNYDLIKAEKESITQKVETDYIAVNIYKDKLIGADSDVTSGAVASAEWTGLAEYTEYHWYINLKNQSGLEKNSKIQRFTTGKAPDPEPDPEPEPEPEPDPDPQPEPDPEPAQPTFPDVGPSLDWAFKEIETMVAKGIIVGHDDGTFKPQDSIERQHSALMFTRALPLEAVEPYIPFKDVPTSHLYYKEITKGQQAGIFEGYNNMFLPTGKLTRAEMAKILVVAFNIEAEGKHNFPDVSDKHWANDYISILSSSGITNGIYGEYRPEEEVTRAQFAVFMHRALEYQDSNQ